ncbi:sulfatase-like hydrolase/transferase [Compostibacter hankyongensis]|uniref:Sulfatase n=1 Tax=Compostibacter hankyongensis TaxID=1007089 RepID=A0ABP8FJI6_9BACT
MLRTTLVILIIAGAAGRILAQTSPPHPQPNILWVTIEDTSPEFIGCYGNPNAHTPNIDKLAEKGVRFTNAFSTGTVCSPSRSTIITGVRTYKTGTGNHRSQYPLPSFIKGFPYYLRQAGYYTTNNAKTDYNIADPKPFIAEAWDESSGKAGWWNRKPGQPFFAVFNFMDSHQSRTMTWSYDQYKTQVWDKLPPSDRIGEQDFDMPPFFRNSPEMRRQFARVYNSLSLTDRKIGALLERLKQDHLTDSTIIFFYSDHGEGVPRGKTNGIDLGYRVAFAIWVPPMYKDLSPWGSGVVSDELVDFEDLAPTLISLAGGKIPAYLKGRIFMGPQRTPPPDYLVLSSDRSDNGIDMIRSITDGRYMYSRNYMPFMPEARYIRYMEIGDIKQQMRKDLAENKLDALQRSLFEDRPAAFLFDTRQDKWETRNLAGLPAYRSLAEKMQQKLDTALTDARDVMFLPEYEIGLISQKTSPYTFRLDKKAYPFETIYAAASLSGKRGKDITAQQIRLLKSPNKIVRYWAALGLRSQDSLDLLAYRPELTRALHDSYPPVAVTVAAIDYGLFGDNAARDSLIRFIGNDNMDLALMAVNYLLYIKNTAPFVRAVEAAKANKAVNYNVKAACNDFLGRLGRIPNDFSHER